MAWGNHEFFPMPSVFDPDGLDHGQYDERDLLPAVVLLGDTHTNVDQHRTKRIL